MLQDSSSTLDAVNVVDVKDKRSTTTNLNDWSASSNIVGPGFYQPWIEQLSDLVSGVNAALLAVKGEQEKIVPVAMWPSSAPQLEQLSEIIEQSIEQKSALVSEFELIADTDSSNYGVAYPIFSDGELMAVIALAVNIENKIDLKQIMRQLQWGASWLELNQTRRQLQIKGLSHQRLSAAVDLFSKILPEREFSAAAIRLVTEMAIMFNCNLVSFGLIEKDSIRVCHFSNSTEFGKQMNLIRLIESAMNESTDQKLPVIYPLPLLSSDLYKDRDQAVSLAHRALAKSQQDETLLSIPLFYENECFGAVTLQRDISLPFTHQEIDECESMLALVAATLEEKRKNCMPLRLKILEASKQEFKNLFGAGHTAYKITMTALALAVLFLFFATGEYRLSADAQLKSSLQRAITAPYDGYIDQAVVMAGDLVEKGDLLLTLDNRDIRLERLRWLSQNNKISSEYQEATADHNRARINILGAQLAQAQAQLKLVESRLLRSEQRAPFSGLIVSGDLSQRLGGSVSKGELLYELSPLNSYRVELQIKESRIVDVKEGQKGVLHLSALPETPFEFIVDKVTPVTKTIDGGTVFIVRATLKNPINELRPGMEGIGKISIDQRNLFGIWTRELREWLRIEQWAWWG